MSDEDGTSLRKSPNDPLEGFVRPAYQQRSLADVVPAVGEALGCSIGEPPGRMVLPEPYTSTSTESITLSSVRSVVVTRMTANPSDGPSRPAEAVMTVGWGGVSRIDLEPAGCSDPQCDADHGYTGVFASDDFSLRVSTVADGGDAVGGLLSFAESLSARTHGA